MLHQYSIWLKILRSFLTWEEFYNCTFIQDYAFCYKRVSIYHFLLQLNIHNKYKWLSGARVRIECKDRKSLQLLYSVEGVTNSEGTYNILVKDDHQDQICETVLVGSPLSSCQVADPGRARANIILTRNNGVLNDIRIANAMGFLRDQALPGCTQLLKQYLESDEQ